MPHLVTNRQADPMSLHLQDGTVANLPGNGTVEVDQPIERIAYHQLVYTRFGAWVVLPGVALTASYPGGQNINLATPQGYEVVYRYEGP